MVLFVIEPENLIFQYVPCTAKAKKKTNWTLKNKKAGWRIFNCYDFTYAGRDAVNQAAKATPSIIKNASSKINDIAQERIDQIISQGGREIERVLPKKLRGSYRGSSSDTIQITGGLWGKRIEQIKKQNFKINVIISWNQIKYYLQQLSFSMSHHHNFFTDKISKQKWVPSLTVNVYTFQLVGWKG